MYKGKLLRDKFGLRASLSAVVPRTNKMQVYTHTLDTFVTLSYRKSEGTFAKALGSQTLFPTCECFPE